MRALLEKDLRLILVRKSNLFIFLIIGAIFSWNFSGSVSGAYLTMLGTMLALSTISFDDSDNCMAFLFTLPCTRKQYVIEKYLFVYGFSLIAGFIGLVIVIISGMAKGSAVTEAELAETIVSELLILVTVGGLLIPLQLKFGPEKSRIVLMLLVGVILAAGFLISKSAYASAMIARVCDLVDETEPICLSAVLIAALAVLTAISVLAASKIMADKEY